MRRYPILMGNAWSSTYAQFFIQVGQFGFIARTDIVEVHEVGAFIHETY